MQSTHASKTKDFNLFLLNLWRSSNDSSKEIKKTLILKTPRLPFNSHVDITIKYIPVMNDGLLNFHVD